MKSRFQLASVVSLTGVVAWFGFAVACGEIYGDGTETPLPNRPPGTGDDGGGNNSDASNPTGENDAGAESDAALARDADAAIDAAGCCDCDGDGYLRASCVSTTDPALIDCDDSDFRRHPKVDFSTADLGTTTHGGDWDCSGVVEKKIATNINCSGKGSGDCTGVGFANDPVCGVATDLIMCELALLICNTKVVTTGARQSCK